MPVTAHVCVGITVFAATELSATAKTKLGASTPART